MKAFVEYTDLFGGESNYDWVHRHEFDREGMTDTQVVRHAKACWVSVVSVQIIAHLMVKC
jgi:hypothetical protein